MIIAAADGSALGNPGPAGWAWYVDDDCWAAGGWKHATNNQGELKAVLELFRATAHLDDDLLVLCDSQYVINSVTKWMRGWKAKGWRKGDGKPVMNLELLKELDVALAGRRYRFEWVKGHANHPLNEAADSRARAVAEAYQRGTAIPSGPGWTGAPNVSAPMPAGDADVNVDDGDESHVDVHVDVSGRAPVQPSLFSFDGEDVDGDDPDVAAELDGLHSITLALSADEHDRLVRRARATGVSVDELLRSLI
ncbi:RNase H family protein [Planctomonas psychrotolerans]|uniref:RNase H family protein n=1 Tax=Planctomonas psychrotolerans TaxID=2528712 RepID=UPI00123B1A20|nr:RNase H family protein [Planctomonas psychrotolerans]